METETTAIQKPRITVDDIRRVEEHFVEVCHRDSIKWGSKKFYDYQSTYFCGAQTAWNAPILKWKIPMMVSRPIIKKEEFEQILEKMK